MSTPDNNLEISGKRDEYCANAECESLKKPIEENSRMAQEGNMSIVPTIHVRQKICLPFKMTGTCPYGEKCRYVHSRGKDKSRESSAITIVNAKSAHVPSQGIGQPKKSVDFTKLKSRLCNQWERNNRCAYGANCIFAHGKAELSRLDYSNPPESRSSADISSLARNVPARNVESNEIGTIAPADRRFKWNDIQWISRIYGDWIESPQPSP